MADELLSQDIVLRTEIKKMPPLSKCMDVLFKFWENDTTPTLLVHSIDEPNFRFGILVRHLVYTQMDCTIMIVDGWLDGEEKSCGQIVEALFMEKELAPLKNLDYWCLKTQKSLSYARYDFFNNVSVIFSTRKKFFERQDLSNIDYLVWCDFDGNDTEYLSQSMRLEEILKTKNKGKFIITVKHTQQELMEKDLLKNYVYSFVTMKEEYTEDQRSEFFHLD